MKGMNRAMGERQINVKALVEALRCSGSVLTDKEKCHKCEYCCRDEVDPKIPVPADYEDDGKLYWESCDCDRMVLDAAELIEQLTAEA